MPHAAVLPQISESQLTYSLLNCKVTNYFLIQWQESMKISNILGICGCAALPSLSLNKKKETCQNYRQAPYFIYNVFCEKTYLLP